MSLAVSCGCNAGCAQGKLAPTSQWGGLRQHGLPNQRAERAPDDDLDRTSEQFLQIGNQAAWEPRTRFTDDIDQQIDIAASRFLPSDDGTANRQVARPVPARQTKDRVALVVQLLGYPHAAPLYPRRGAPKRPTRLPSVPCGISAL